MMNFKTFDNIISRILNLLFSFRLTGIVLLLLASSMAVATFIENDFGTETARAHIYNAAWFEFLLGLAMVNLAGSMLIHKTYKKSKLTILMFHLSFILIILGGAITRYAGYTGMLYVREGEQSNMMYLDEPYLRVRVNLEDRQVNRNKKIYLSEIRNPKYIMNFRVKGKKLRIGYLGHTEKPFAEDPSSDARMIGLSMRISYEGESEDLTLWNPQGMPGESELVGVGPLAVSITFGNPAYRIPFSIYLRDFIITRYPGSENPESYESLVDVVDPEQNTREPRSISMNNILNYRGYRFYQASYMPDEKGTVLSVNRDPFGTTVTYIGYFFLFLGILLSLLNPKSRFRNLWSKLEGLSGVTRVLIIVMLSSFITASAVAGTETTGIPAKIPEGHAARFGELLVQDFQGRIKPLNSLSSEVLRKVSREEKFDDQSPDQVLLGMISDPESWQKVPMIRLSHEGIIELIGTGTNYASFEDFFTRDEEEKYILAPYLMEAFRKEASDRSKFDTEVLRVDERVNICYRIYTHNLLRIFPDKNDSISHTWHNPYTLPMVYSGEDSLFTCNILPMYLESVVNAQQSGNWEEADRNLDFIKIFQQRMSTDILPSTAKQRTEIIYNRLDLFENISSFYLLVGLILLITLIITILNPRRELRIFRLILYYSIFLLFAGHTAGLIIRWYISGHAPWSDGYESMIYISWATVLAGLLFSLKNQMPVAVTAILASIMLHVAHMSWMDPQITTLVPVLNSYWLVIHVAVIASSYGFLGLAAILAFVNLVLMALLRSSNRESVLVSIRKITILVEMIIIAGLGLLSIGTFLGGIWANESWGRYWGWDPKETWALITILIYAFITHMRYIPGLKKIFTFNLVALVAYSSVLMTYFGVNYYLSGIHSYAKGDPLTLPVFMWYVIGIIVVLSIWSFINLRMRKAGKLELN